MTTKNDYFKLGRLVSIILAIIPITSRRRPFKIIIGLEYHMVNWSTINLIYWQNNENFKYLTFHQKKDNFKNIKIKR